VIRKNHIYPVLFLIAALCCNSCTTKKNTLVNRSYHNLTSRYNGYFYARESINEGTEKLENSHVDDYDKILPIFVYGDLKESQSIAGELDKTFKKGSMVVERHSMLIKGVEYCNWIDDTYLLIGRSHFYKHDYFAGLEVFDYVASQFKKEPTHYEAWLWMLRTYNEMGLFTKSQGLLDVIKNDKAFPKKLNGELYAIQADFYIKQADYQAGIDHLIKAIAGTKKKKVRTRYIYILAQLYQKTGQLKSATNNFKNVIRRNPPYVMAFNAKISLARSYEAGSGNSNDIKRQLQKMLRDEKNIEYLDQINYALAEIYIKENNIPVAIKYLKQSIASSSLNTKQKALSNLRLADLYFDIPNYPFAEAYYDSAVSLLEKDYPNYNQIVDKKNSLTDLVKDIDIISREDSLQRIAKLSDAERSALIDKMMAEVLEAERKKKEEQEIQALNNSQNLNPNKQAGDVGSGAGFYFYNQGLLSAGFSDFSRKWGSRKLEDNWRRSNKQSGASDFDNNASVEALKAGKDSLADAAPKLRDKESYLKDIPMNDSMLAKSNANIVEAYYDLGGIYKEQLKNNEKAAETYEELLKRYPKNKHELETYYQLYRLYLVMKDKENAKKYKDILLNEHPQSEYAQIIKNPDFNKELEQSKNKSQRYYEEVYDLFQKGEYAQVKSRVKTADTLFGKNDLKPKFDYLNALAIGKTQPVEDFEQALQQVILTYPKNEVTPAAQAILDVIRARKGSGEIAPRDTSAGASPYNFNPEAEQFIVLLLDSKNLRVPEVKSKLSNFNTDFFESAGLKIEDIIFDPEHKMLVVKAFSNKTKAMLYYNQLNNNTLIKELDKKQYALFVISDENYPKFYSLKKTADYLAFFNKNYNK
jgi:tetratricopeptide (TPR) repeat protein